MKIIKVHHIDMFNTDVLVCVGINVKELLRWGKKNSTAVEKTWKSEEKQKATQNLMDGSLGFLDNFGVDGVPYYMLWLKEFKNDFEVLDVLNHEIVHLKQFLFKNKGISTDEIECEAYFQETTFKNIRRLLFKELDKWEKKHSSKSSKKSSNNSRSKT